MHHISTFMSDAQAYVLAISQFTLSSWACLRHKLLLIEAVLTDQFDDLRMEVAL